MTLSDQEIPVLYAWIDELPLSRPKRNISRDFSDGVLIAEIFKHFFPKMVDLHNYPAANSVAQKLYNWNTLNQKIFRKIGLAFSTDLINNVAYAKPGFIEELLFQIKGKIEEIQQSFQYQDQQSGFDPTQSQFNLNPSHVQQQQQQQQNQQQQQQQQMEMSYQEPMFQQPQQPWQMNPPFSGAMSYGYPDMQQQQQNMFPTPIPPFMNPMSGFQDFQQQQVSPFPNPFPSAPSSSQPQQSQQQPPVPAARTNKSKSKKPVAAGAIPNNTKVQKGTDSLSKALAEEPSTDKKHEKERMINDLQETIEILQLKVSKLEKLIELKDRKIQELATVPATKRK